LPEHKHGVSKEDMSGKKWAGGLPSYLYLLKFQNVCWFVKFDHPECYVPLLLTSEAHGKQALDELTTW